MLVSQRIFRQITKTSRINISRSKTAIVEYLSGRRTKLGILEYCDSRRNAVESRGNLCKMRRIINKNTYNKQTYCVTLGIPYAELFVQNPQSSG